MDPSTSSDQATAISTLQNIIALGKELMSHYSDLPRVLRDIQPEGPKEEWNAIRTGMITQLSLMNELLISKVPVVSAGDSIVGTDDRFWSRRKRDPPWADPPYEALQPWA